MSRSLPVLPIGLCGLGTVGLGVWKHLQASRDRLERRLGARLEITRVAVRDPMRPRPGGPPGQFLTDDALAVATDPSIRIVCELIGGTGIARDLTLAALARGKTVVTANKALLCAHGPELFAAARRHGGHLYFEASVAGGIPIIKALREGLVANRFPSILGILNGTCNYILTRMEREGLGYREILADAQRLGYAEADPTLDVEGWDTAHKAAVLTFLAHGCWVRPESMVVEGITGLNQDDIRRANELGHTIRLVAHITRDFAAHELFVRVHPTLVPRGHVLAAAVDVNNAICVTGDVAGTTTYVGRGAGQDATASAVISDLVDAATLVQRGPSPIAPPAEEAAPPLEEPPPAIGSLGGIASRFYLRLTVADAPGVLATVASALAARGISLASVLQEPGPGPDRARLFLTTHVSNEAALAAARLDLASRPVVLEPPLLLRLLEPSA